MDEPTPPAAGAEPPAPWPLTVISGGQTGADQAGLLAAGLFALPTGGWMPRGWRTADGPRPDLGERFGLREHAGDYPERTRANVEAADGTIRFAASFATYGERCTLKWLRHAGKPFLDVDLARPVPPEEAAAWVRAHAVHVLNVAGNPEPRSPRARAAGITAFVVEYLSRVFELLGHRAVDRPAADPPAAS